MQALQIDKAKRWAKQISITGAAQIIVQAVGFLSGILVIRLLPVEQYAYYTIANTMLGTMTVLSDSGISSGVMAQGGKVWQDKKKLGAVLQTGLSLRKRFAWGAITISIPILCYLLWKQGAGWITCLLIATSLIPAFFAALSDNILQIVPKLHQSVTPLQRNQVYVGIGRLLLSALTLFAFPWAFVAVLASGIPRIWGNRKLQKIAEPYVSRTQQVDKDVQGEMMKMIKKLMPDAIYYCFSGQLSIWLISFFGQTESVAYLGALGRFPVMLNLISILYSVLVIPRFAKLPLSGNLLAKKFSVILISLWIVGLSIIGVTYLFSDYLLLLLGNNYQGLNVELLLIIISGIISLGVGVLFNINASRGWPIPPVISITINLIFVTMGIIMFDLTNLRGVIYLGILSQSSLAFCHFLNFIVMIAKKPL